MSFSWEKTLIYHFLGKKRILFAVLNTLGNYKNIKNDQNIQRSSSNKKP